ncbi:peptidylprolyl isomerase [Methylomagnum sp.]
MRKTPYIAIALLLAGCQGGSNVGSLVTATGAMPAGYAPKDVVATVNGKPIPRSALAMPRQGGAQIPEDKLIDDLIARELVRQHAEQQNLAADPAFVEKTDNYLRVALSQLAAEDFVKKAPITDAEVKKEYDEKVAAMSGTEYRARHILVASEAEAQSVIAKLGKGAKFEDLAKKLSIDTGSKPNGGELGWFSPQQLVPEFAAAVEGLKDGQITDKPVKSQFGWHVIQREEARRQQAPDFEQVKPQVRNMLQTQKFQQQIEEWKKTAKIERKAAPAKPAEAAQADKPAESAPAKP